MTDRRVKRPSGSRTVLFSVSFIIDVQRTLNSQTDKCNNTFVKTLTKELRKGSDLRVLVFVKARDTCRELAASLDKELDAFGIKTHYLYGKDMRSGIEGELLQNW